VLDLRTVALDPAHWAGGRAPGVGPARDLRTYDWLLEQAGRHDVVAVAGDLPDIA